MMYCNPKVLSYAAVERFQRSEIPIVVVDARRMPRESNIANAVEKMQKENMNLCNNTSQSFPNKIPLCQSPPWSCPEMLVMVVDAY